MTDFLTDFFCDRFLFFFVTDFFLLQGLIIPVPQLKIIRNLKFVARSQEFSKFVARSDLATEPFVARSSLYVSTIPLSLGTICR